MEEEIKEIENFTIDNVRNGADINVYYAHIKRCREEGRKEAKRLDRRLYTFSRREKLKKYFKEYHQRPEVIKKRKAYGLEYNSRPEVKLRMKQYVKDNVEKRKKWAKEYHKRPEVKAKARARYHRPGVKEKKRLYEVEYNKRPDVIARKKELDQQRRDKKRNDKNMNKSI